MADEGKPTITPDHVVIDKPQTAQDLFLMGMQGNPGNLATAVNTKPGEHYTLSINIALRFTRDDVFKMLRAGGYQIDFPGGNAGNEPSAP